MSAGDRPVKGMLKNNGWVVSCGSVDVQKGQHFLAGIAVYQRVVHLDVDREPATFESSMKCTSHGGRRRSRA